MQSVTKSKNFNVSNITLSEVRVNNYGGKSAYINYNGDKKPLILQTPKMKMPYAMSVFRPENASDEQDSKYSISLAFNKNDDNIKQFYDKMVEMDNKLISLAVKNSQKWFKKKHKKSVIEALYSPIV